MDPAPVVLGDRTPAQLTLLRQQFGRLVTGVRHDDHLRPEADTVAPSRCAIVGAIASNSHGSCANASSITTTSNDRPTGPRLRRGHHPILRPVAPVDTLLAVLADHLRHVAGQLRIHDHVDMVIPTARAPRCGPAP